MAKHYGRCALCGQESELTFEHIPPRKAFNWFPQRTISGDTWLDSFSDPLRKPWDVEDLHYNNQQRGIGLYSLCQKCNNFTGARYGNEYVRFTHGLHALMEKEQAKPGMTMFVESAQFRPLPVMKQIVSMFCSMHQRMHDRSDMELLRKFVLDEHSTDFPKDKFRLGMYLFHGGVNIRSAKASKEQLAEMKREHEESIRLQVIPFLQIEETAEAAHGFELDLPLAAEEKSDWTMANIVKIKNLGNGAATNITYEWSSEKNEISMSEAFPINAISAGGEYKACFSFDCVKSEIDTVIGTLIVFMNEFILT